MSNTISIGDTIICNCRENDFFSGKLEEKYNINEITDDQCQRYFNTNINEFKEFYPGNNFIYIVRGHRANLQINFALRSEWISSFGQEYIGLSIYEFKRLYMLNNPEKLPPNIPKKCYDMIFTDNIIKYLTNEDFLDYGGNHSHWKTLSRP